MKSLVETSIGLHYSIVWNIRDRGCILKDWLVEGPTGKGVQGRVSNYPEVEVSAALAAAKRQRGQRKGESNVRGYWGNRQHG